MSDAAALAIVIATFPVALLVLLGLGLGRSAARPMPPVDIAWEREHVDEALALAELEPVSEYEIKALSNLRADLNSWGRP